MLLFPNTRHDGSYERPLAAGVVIEAEGQALIGVYTAGVFGVKPSTGAANEVFAGVSLSRPISPTHMPVVERLTVPASGVVALKAAPVAGSARIANAASNAVFTQVAGAPAAATEVKVDATASLTFQAAIAGTVVIATYLRDLTVAQSLMVQGNQDIGGPAGAYFGQVGLIVRGDVYTDQFDTTADWSNPVDLRLGANGKFTIGGTGTKVPGYVLATPVEGAAFLGIHINAA